MSINDAALLQATDDVFYHLGDDATFYPLDGDPIVCKVDIAKDGQNEPDGFTSQARGEQITLEGPRHTLGKVPVAKTAKRDGEKFIMDDGTIYEVLGIQETDNFFVLCSVRVCE
jgi:hypothetical protein